MLREIVHRDAPLDDEERETVRAEIRRAALARLGPHSESARVVDAGGEFLEELPSRGAS